MSGVLNRFAKRRQTLSPIKPKSKGSSHLDSYWVPISDTVMSYTMQSVIRPRGAQLQDWLSLNLIETYTQINLLYSSIEDLCTEQSCPKMNAGSQEYLWADNEEILEPIEVSAPKYVEYLMKWVWKKVKDPKIFPVDEGVDFPASFKNITETMLKRLFRVYAHIYHAHFNPIKERGLEFCLNVSFVRFYAFVLAFDLVPLGEMEPLTSMLTKLNAQMLRVSKSPQAREMWQGVIPGFSRAKVTTEYSSGSTVLKVGNIVTILDPRNNEQWEGEWNGQLVTFPASCVQTIIETLAP